MYTEQFWGWGGGFFPFHYVICTRQTIQCPVSTLCWWLRGPTALPLIPLSSPPLFTLPIVMEICSSAFLYPSPGIPTAAKVVIVHLSVRMSAACHWLQGMPVNHTHQSQACQSIIATNHRVSDGSFTDGKRTVRLGKQGIMGMPCGKRWDNEISQGHALALPPISQMQGWPF